MDSQEHNLKDGVDDKLVTQRKEIKKYLTNNSQSFWVNTIGFETLFRN